MEILFRMTQAMSVFVVVAYIYCKSPLFRSLKAFEENALDYLLKPVEKGRLAKTVEKLKKRFAEGGRPVFTGPAIQKYPASIRPGSNSSIRR